MKKIIILGVTGSIGRNAVDVVLAHPDSFKVVAVAALRSKEACEQLAARLGAKAYTGDDAAVRAVEENEADVCLVATVGLSGLSPTLAAIEKGMDIALATKEVMVMAGELVTSAARRKGVKFLPVDSEHSAVFQCLAGRTDPVGVERLILTASGGPFLERPADLSAVTPAEALNHPRWKMGPKVTVDSATMMNKGFEILEARLSPPDMRVAIQYALSAPARLPSERAKLDLASIGALTFRRPDPARFPCLGLVKAACRAGGCATAVLAAADEWAVAEFLAGRLRFTDIARSVEDSLSHAPATACDSVDAVFAAAEWTRSRLAGGHSVSRVFP